MGWMFVMFLQTPMEEEVVIDGERQVLERLVIVWNYLGTDWGMGKQVFVE